MNETLEAMARALFKSWFVDFDPVRAKAEGRDPGLPKPLADLFPDSFEDSELGEIPKGWMYFAGLCSARLIIERTAPDEIDYLDLANTKWGNIETAQRHAWGAAPIRAQRVLRPGDTIVGTVRPGNGSFAFISEAGAPEVPDSPYFDRECPSIKVWCIWQRPPPRTSNDYRTWRTAPHIPLLVPMSSQPRRLCGPAKRLLNSSLSWRPR